MECDHLKFIKLCVEITKEPVKELNSYASLVKFPLTETEIKAFNLIRKRNINEFKKLNLKNVNIQYDGNYLLFQAIFYEKLDIVKYLVEKGADLSIRDKHGRNAVQYALLYNKTTAIAQYLLSKGNFQLSSLVKNLMIKQVKLLDENQIVKKDETGSTLLHYICAIGDVDLFNKMKLEVRCDYLTKNHFQIKDNEGFTCIDRAAANGHLEMLKMLKEITKFQLDYSDDIATSILFKILKLSPNDKVLEWWLEAVITHPDDMKQNILFEVNGRSPDALSSKLRLLSEFGFNLRKIDNHGNSVTMRLAENALSSVDLNNSNVIAPDDANPGEFLHVQNEFGQNVLHIAAQHANFELVDLADIVDIDMNIRDNHNFSCFHYGIKYGHIDILKRIPKKLDKQEQFRMISIAIINERNEIFMELLKTYKEYNLPEFKVKLNRDHMNKAYPSRLLEVAVNAEKNWEDVNGLVLNIIKNCKLENILDLKKSFLDYSDEEGAKILHIASLFGRNDVILWLLLEKEYDVFSTDKSGNTALYYAAENNQILTIILLIMFGLHYKNIKDTQSKDFNNIVPFINYLSLEFICSIYELGSTEIVRNILKSLNKDTLIELKASSSSISKLIVEEVNGKNSQINENIYFLMEIFGSLSETEYLVEYTRTNEYTKTKNDDKKIKLGILKIEYSKTVRGLQKVQNYKIEPLVSDLENKKSSDIEILDFNKNFLIVVDESVKKDKKLSIYYRKKNENKFVFHESLPIKKWYFEIKRFILEEDNAWIIKYNEQDKTVNVYNYICLNNEVKRKDIERLKIMELGLIFESGYEYIHYFFTPDKRFLIILKLKSYMYFIDLKNQIKPTLIDPEIELHDVRVTKGTEISYDLIAKSTKYVKYVRVTVQDNELKVDTKKLIETNGDLRFNIEIKNDVLIAAFDSYMEIYKLSEIRIGFDKMKTFNKQTVCWTDSENVSDICVTNDNNYLTYSTHNIINKTYKLHEIDLNDTIELELKNNNMNFSNFTICNQNNSILCASDGVPYVLVNGN